MPHTVGKVEHRGSCCTTIEWEIVIPISGGAIRYLAFGPVNCLGLVVDDTEPMTISGFAPGDYTATVTNDGSSVDDITSFVFSDTSDTYGGFGTIVPGASVTRLGVAPLDGTPVTFTVQNEGGAGAVSGTIRFCSA
jgi:hypothetical protein